MITSNLTAGRQSHGAPGPIDRRHGFTGDELDLLLLVEGVGPQPQIVEAAFAGEIGFRQRRRW